jgi:hypothetical protein
MPDAGTMVALAAVLAAILMLSAWATSGVDAAPWCFPDVPQETRHERRWHLLLNRLRRRWKP